MDTPNPQPAHNAARVESQPRRGLRRREAALYVGVSPTTFDYWVGAGWMPPGKRIGKGVVLWDIRALDEAFDALMEEGHINPWDPVIEYREIKVPAPREGRTPVSAETWTVHPPEGFAGDPGVPIGVSGRVDKPFNDFLDGKALSY